MGKHPNNHWGNNQGKKNSGGQGKGHNQKNTGSGGQGKATYRLYDDLGIINPYTFVPVEKTVTRNKENKSNPLRTGVLHCSLYVKSPLAIPDTDRPSEDQKGHKTYPFYQLNDSYAIPGSSIRGMLRSVHETVTNSCMVTLKKDTFLSRRVAPKDAYNPGILKEEDGKYVLYKAKRYVVLIDRYKPLDNNKQYFSLSDRKIKGHKTGDVVAFDSIPSDHVKNGRIIWEDGGIVTKIGEGTQKGILFIGERIGNKHGESIFEQSDKIDVSPDVIAAAYARLKATWAMYNDEGINKNFDKTHFGYKGHEKLNPSDGVPLWYSYDKENDMLHFSYASIGRTMYQNTVNDLVGQGKDTKPCDRHNRCESCGLFGTVGDSETGSGMVSKVRVCDAKALARPQTELVTLQELGTPRNSYLPFYMKNYKEGSDYDTRGAEIAGRKYYWHHKEPNPKNKTFQANEKAKRNTTMELVQPGAKFSFDIFYDGITDEQFEQLLWTITIGENKPDSTLCHRLGHGRPLGLGSVKLAVDSCTERTFDGADYHVFPVDIPEQISEDAVQSSKTKYVKAILDRETLNKGDNENYSVGYPDLAAKDKDSKEKFMEDVALDRGASPNERGSKDNLKARHQWYTKNKDDKTIPMQTLPTIFDDKDQVKPQALKAILYEKAQNANWGGSVDRGRRNR